MLTIQCECKNTYTVDGPLNPNDMTAICPHCGNSTSISAKVASVALKKGLNRFIVFKGGRAVVDNLYREAPVDTKNSTLSHKITPSNLTPSKIISNIKTYRIVSSIIWIVIGVIQLILLYTAPVGVWNIVNAILTLVYTKNLVAGNAGVVGAYEKQKVSLIIAAVINLIFGGVVGVFLVAADWISRDYVLKNRHVFEIVQNTSNVQNSEEIHNNKNFCHKCGTKLLEGAKFCSNCGTQM